MEVFLAFCDLNDVPLLEKTADAWEEAGFEPVGLQIKNRRKFEMFRRIVADEKAEGTEYLLADLGCVIHDPADKEKLVLGKNVGMAGLKGGFESLIPCGVRLCSKGAVRKWEPQITDTYDVEHARAIKNAGKKVEVFRDIFYTRLQAH